MSIKSLNALHDNIKSADLKEALENERYAELLTDAFVELDHASEIAKNLILEKMDEKDFVKFLSIVQKLTSAIGISVENHSSLLFAEMDGALQGYTHTVVLAAIGTLIEEEIL